MANRGEGLGVRKMGEDNKELQTSSIINTNNYSNINTLILKFIHKDKRPE